MIKIAYPSGVLYTCFSISRYSSPFIGVKSWIIFINAFRIASSFLLSTFPLRTTVAFGTAKIKFIELFQTHD